MHVEELPTIKEAVELQQEMETCDRCRKSVPVLNRALHRVKCRGEQGLEEQNLGEETAQPSSNTNINEPDKDGINDPSGQSIELRSSSSSKQWECRFCTFLNDQTDLTATQQCIMCGNSSSTATFPGTWSNDAGNDERMSNWTAEVYDDDSDDEIFSDVSSGTSDDNNSENDDDFEVLDTWTCSYCTVVNTSCERNCTMCDMPNTAVTDSQRHVRSSIESHTPTASSMLPGMEAVLPALCYLGVTAGAMLTDTRGSSSRVRTGLLSSLVGSLAGLAVAAYLTNERDESDPPPGHVDTRGSDPAERLPVHRYQCGSISTTEEKPSDNGDIEDDRVSCRICMENYEQAVEIKTLKCFHMFHASCIDEWLLQKPSCPLCCTDV